MESFRTLKANICSRFSSSKLPQRLIDAKNFFQDKICIYLSFYDYIRIFKAEWLMNNRTAYERIYIPISYILSCLETAEQAHDNRYKYYDNLLINTIFVEICYNEQLLNKLRANYINSLSKVCDLPISYIYKYDQLNWDYQYIAGHNTTFQAQDLQKFRYPFNFYINTLSYNSTVLLEWLMPYMPKELPFGLLTRLTIKQIGYLYKQGYILNWKVLSMDNHCITKEDILAHPDYPWDYQHMRIYISDDITPNFYYLDSEFLDYEDIKKLGYINQYIYNNPNLTLKEFKKLDTSLGMVNLNKMDRPKLRRHYQKIYSTILIELLY